MLLPKLVGAFFMERSIYDQPSAKPQPPIQHMRTAQTGVGRKGNRLVPLLLPPARAHYPRRKIIREVERKASKIKAFSKNLSDYF